MCARAPEWHIKNRVCEESTYGARVIALCPLIPRFWRKTRNMMCSRLNNPRSMRPGLTYLIFIYFMNPQRFRYYGRGVQACACVPVCVVSVARMHRLCLFFGGGGGGLREAHGVGGGLCLCTRTECPARACLSLCACVRSARARLRSLSIICICADCGAAHKQSARVAPTRLHRHSKSWATVCVWWCGAVGRRHR